MDASSLSGRRIAVGVGGGIAAYKVCELVRTLTRASADVRVSQTRAAQAFVTPLTFQSLSGHPVLTEAYDPSQEAGFGHIELARWAELYIVAPATADLLARLRMGMGDDAVTTSLLAYRGPVLLAPSMNVAMWENLRTQQNLSALLAEGRFSSVGPDAGALACGEVGSGRLAEVDEVVQAAVRALGAGPLQGRRVLITAGPTREYLDPVRFLSNPSTGKMGLALAQEARALGAQVTVVLGPVDPRADRQGLEVVDVVSAEDMLREVLPRIDGADLFIATAAVSDFRPAQRHPHKVKKGAAEESLQLVATPDVLAQVSERVKAKKASTLLVGFAAESEEVVAHAREKLSRKGLDVIVANDVTAPGSGFAVETNQVTVLWRSGESRELAGSKREVARSLLSLLLPSLKAGA